MFIIIIIIINTTIEYYACGTPGIIGNIPGMKAGRTVCIGCMMHIDWYRWVCDVLASSGEALVIICWQPHFRLQATTNHWYDHTWSSTHSGPICRSETWAKLLDMVDRMVLGCLASSRSHEAPGISSRCKLVIGIIVYCRCRSHQCCRLSVATWNTQMQRLHFLSVQLLQVAPYLIHGNLCIHRTERQVSSVSMCVLQQVIITAELLQLHYTVKM